MKRFGDVYVSDRKSLDGTKLQLCDLINKEIIVVDYSLTKSKCKNTENCLTIQFTYPDEPERMHVVFTSSMVLIKQIQQVEQHLPLVATIKSVHNYYVFV